MTDRKRLTILGSTGSVGASTLDVVARHRDRFEVVALTAHHQTETLFKQCVAFRPAIAVMLEPAAAAELRQPSCSSA
jgi:1-deoxy-D-xylulose-5-phosphate reductoisomerase